MPIPKKVRDYLKKSETAFEEVAHKTVYTAYDLAQTLKSELKDIGKALIVKADRAYVLVIVPASARVNVPKLKKALRVKKLSIPDEKVIVKVFKVKKGSISAFGKLHKIETVVDKGLLKVKKVVLQTGSFTDSVRVKVADFIKMEEAQLASIAQMAGYKKIKKTPKKKAKAKVKKAVKIAPKKKVVKKKKKGKK